MDKLLNPWVEEFYTTNTVVEKPKDEIQHYGTASSGRYPRGSGKHPSKGGTTFGGPLNLGTGQKKMYD